MPCFTPRSCDAVTISKFEEGINLMLLDCMQLWVVIIFWLANVKVTQLPQTPEFAFCPELVTGILFTSNDQHQHQYQGESFFGSKEVSSEVNPEIDPNPQIQFAYTKHSPAQENVRTYFLNTV